MTEKLSTFILSLMNEYFKLIEARIELEVCSLPVENHCEILQNTESKQALTLVS